MRVRKPVHADEFLSYGELAARYTEGVDYAVQVLHREQSRVAILAPHGGLIEGRTSQVARLIAGEQHRLYLFEGLRTADYGRQLRLPASRQSSVR
jgi:phage replication-related protein YjqB (UPF0714/DUF867 family)